MSRSAAAAQAAPSPRRAGRRWKSDPVPAPRLRASDVKQRTFTLVTTGLDPVVHADMRLQSRAEHLNELRRRMDCRVKPGKDARKKKGSGTPANALSSVPHRTGAVAPRKDRLAPPLRSRARSPAGVPPRLLPRGVWSLGAIRARLRGQSRPRGGGHSADS